MNYKESKQFIEDTKQYGSRLGLNSVKELLRRLDSPQDKLNIIHIAGTNGKGSTLAFVSAILKEAGYKVGTFCSPTVFSYREMIQIDASHISRESFAAICTEIREIIGEMLQKGFDHPTVFEIETTIAFIYFERQSCDFSVIETGMGGLDDATNVADQVTASVITSIGMDHVGILGDSIEKIAECKSGIIKEGCPVILYGQDDIVMDIIKNKAKMHNAKVYTTDNHAVECIRNVEDGYRQKMSYTSGTGNKYDHVSLQLLGTFQGNNAATAIETMEVLNDRGFQIPYDSIIKGLESTVWNGRFQCICKEPLMFIDGAHNPDAAKRFVETVEMYFTNYEIIYIIGMLSDKNYYEVIKRSVPAANRIITITPDHERALDGRILADAISDFHQNAEYAESVHEAVKKAFMYSESAEKESVIIAFGSLSYFKEVCVAVQASPNH